MCLKLEIKEKRVYTVFLDCSTVNETWLLQESITLMPYELPSSSCHIPPLSFQVIY
jgi:hypothetical protein